MEEASDTAVSNFINSKLTIYTKIGSMLNGTPCRVMLLVSFAVTFLKTYSVERKYSIHAIT